MSGGFSESSYPGTPTLRVPERLTWDQRMMSMQSLGELFLYMQAPFDWRVLHQAVLIIDDEEGIVPQGRGTNPYGAADAHWQQLTRPGTVVECWGPHRHVTWRGFRWLVLPDQWPVSE